MAKTRLPPPDRVFTIHDAERALASKSDARIQAEAAWKWAALAQACFRRRLRAATAQAREAWNVRARGYVDEALEHAALSGDVDLVATLQREFMRTATAVRRGR